MENDTEEKIWLYSNSHTIKIKYKLLYVKHYFYNHRIVIFFNNTLTLPSYMYHNTNLQAAPQWLEWCMKMGKKYRFLCSFFLSSSSFLSCLIQKQSVYGIESHSSEFLFDLMYCIILCISLFDFPFLNVMLKINWCDDGRR